MAAFGDSCG
jgi:hypothetical protein